MSKRNGYYSPGVYFLGYTITNKLTDRNGRKIVVVKRNNCYVNDYAVGLGYNDTYGHWEQGIYGFETRDQALDYAKHMSRRSVKREKLYRKETNQ